MSNPERKYQVIQYRQKKNKISQQVAIFYNLEDAIFWENHLRTQKFIIQTEVVPVL